MLYFLLLIIIKITEGIYGKNSCCNRRWCFGYDRSRRAAELGADVHLFERNTTLGNKLLITGKGRCNITNLSDIDNIIKNIPGNGKFIYCLK